MIKLTSVNIIEVNDLNKLVEETYGKPYDFQQQDDCKDRGIEYFTVPCYPEDYENDTIPEVVNGSEMGVSFKAWLKRDPKQGLSSEDKNNNNISDINLWWTRNFYPHLSILVNDLYEKGLLPAGDYGINIDW
jgi:hypothetical protein